MEALLPRAVRALSALPGPPLSAASAPLDALRARLLRAIAPHARALIVAREPRVALVASLLLCTAWLGTAAIPIWLIALGPILWGIPHILADIRYLITRPGFHQRPWVVLAIAGSVVAGALGAGVRGALTATVFAALTARGAWPRRLTAAAVAAAFLALAAWAGWKSDIAFAHLHHLVGLGLWWAWRRRAGRLHWIPIALFVAGCALIAAGAAEPILARTGGDQLAFHRLSWSWLARTLAPPGTGAVWANRLVLLYAYGQAAHYVIWLRAIPEDDRPSPTPRSFAQSFRALAADVGTWLLWATVLGMIGLGLWALVDLGEARDAYLRAAFFHGYVELIAAAVLWVEGDRARRGAAPIARGAAIA